VSRRREFVQRLPRARNIAALIVACAAAHIAQTAETHLEPHALARSFAPGEVVRFEVAADGDVRSLRGTFEKAALTFSRVDDERRPGVWVAWGVIPLDAGAGPAAYSVTATLADGHTTATEGRITVESKSFPEQRLTVESKFVNPPKAELKRIERERKRLAAIFARRTPLPPPESPFLKPVPGDPTSDFGTRRIFNGEPRAPHPGIDLRAASGTPVAALAASLYYSGGTVILDHGGGLFTVYGHLSRIGTKEGATVNAGDVIGLSGATGRVTGPHLHWGAKVGEVIFDPRALLDPRLFGLPAAAAPR
jgi:murein DD-endopeptidase MepM/ murein hydrolase activator NlpD